MTRALKLADIRAVFQRRRFETLREEFYRDLWYVAAQQTGASIRKIFSGFYEIEKGGLATFVSRSDLMLDDILTTRIMAHKGLTYRLLAEKGFRVPDHLEFSLGNLAEAERFLFAQPGMVVVKPATGTGAGLGVTTAIATKRELRRAARYAASFNRELLIEPHLEGSSYRLTYLDGQYLDAVRRDSPEVVGDGRTTIRNLITLENTRRLEERPISALHPIIVDAECCTHLARQGLSPASKPKPGQTITVKGAVNENAAAQNHSIRDLVHPDTIKAGAELVRDLGVRFAGVDLISDDIKAPFSHEGTIVSEINVNPGIQHHYLVSDRLAGTPIAGQILNHLFENRQGVMVLNQQNPESAAK
ncbi:MAG: cyanophycin synthetase [Alphaproteobacteria bacterium]|nr:cyanophycin synthetase [Alphaproteobacteria bacterium]